MTYRMILYNLGARMEMQLVSKESLVSGRYFRGFEIWSDGKRVFACNDVEVHRDEIWGLAVYRCGEDLPIWSDDGSPCDVHIVGNGFDQPDYLTIGY